MKSNTLTSAVRALSLLLLASGSCALAQDRGPIHFTGLINDYTPSTVKGGPYEMHGQWTMDIYLDRRVESGFVADFSADMTMSDYGTTNGLPDATKGGQSPHTHHIKLTNKTVTTNMDGCPTFSPATLTGFQINGTVSLITGNGSKAPFENPDGPPASTLQVCITGGDPVQYSVTNSNISLVFGGPATSHFGTQAIHGVVRNATPAPIEKDR
ncbi:MAG TPA: hypothetical protein VHZ52_15735 [Acidobacteriaceae bacterium]|jgi:hypothetical protein|nr:hypothetical protein [Acidobacteriaceae bacterium]